MTAGSLKSKEQQQWAAEKELRQDSGASCNEESSKEDDSGSELTILKKALNEFTQESGDKDIFILHCEPRTGKIVLTEAQFNLVKKVYTRCFVNGRFSLGDNQLVTQFFLNLKAFKDKLNAQPRRR